MSNCNCCAQNIILRSMISTAAVDAGNTYVLLTPDTELSPVNEQKVSLMVNTSIPSGGMILPVYVVMNGANVPMFDKYGNILC